MVNLRVREGTGIALPVHPSRYPPSPHPGYTPTVPGMATGACSGSAARPKEVVGLISVAQLTLRALFSGFRVMTEVYNLVVAGNPDDHFLIPGNE